MSVIKDFDPNTQASSDGIFGLPFDADSAKLILLPAPWEVTTSYGEGTAEGPQCILEASVQVDLFHRDFPRAYENGYFMAEVPLEWKEKNTYMKKQALWVRAQTSQEGHDALAVARQIREINQASALFNSWVHEQSRKILAQGKFCAVLGGDHSTPYGLIQALGEKYHCDYSILHFDAHHDLRPAYQGFTHSHASILYNVMTSAFAPKKLVQVGIRDFCEEEFQMAKERSDIECFYDQDIVESLFQGKTWDDICGQIVSQLSDRVYITTDIDGLSPDLCPHTGTPVPGGLNFAQFGYLLKKLVESGRKIIGFDLVEVAPDPQGFSEINGNIGARVLFQLCGWTMKSQGLA